MATTTYRPMQDDPTSAPKRSQAEIERAARDARVAAALRANLLKRKAQARARNEQSSTSDDGTDTSQVSG